MRTEILYALKAKYLGDVQAHKLNIDILLNNPRAIPEHEDFVSAIDKELTKLVDALDKLNTLTKEFIQ